MAFHDVSFVPQVWRRFPGGLLLTPWGFLCRGLPGRKRAAWKDRDPWRAVQKIFYFTSLAPGCSCCRPFVRAGRAAVWTTTSFAGRTAEIGLALKQCRAGRAVRPYAV